MTKNLNVAYTLDALKKIINVIRISLIVFKILKCYSRVKTKISFIPDTFSKRLKCFLRSLALSCLPLCTFWKYFKTFKE